LLIRLGGEVLRESSSRSKELDCSLLSGVSRKEAGGSNGSHIRASGRERGVESAVTGSWGRSNDFTTSSRISACKDDAQTTISKFLEFSVETITIRIRRIVSLRAIADRVDEGGVGLVIDLTGPGEEIAIEVEALQRIEPGRDVRSNSHDVLDVQASFKRRQGWVVLSNNLGDALEGGERHKLAPELLEVRGGVILSLEFSDGVHVARVDSDD
jgi:hypothetical protein